MQPLMFILGTLVGSASREMMMVMCTGSAEDALFYNFTVFRIRRICGIEGYRQRRFFCFCFNRKRSCDVWFYAVHLEQVFEQVLYIYVLINSPDHV